MQSDDKNPRGQAYPVPDHLQVHMPDLLAFTEHLYGPSVKFTLGPIPDVDEWLAVYRAERRKVMQRRDWAREDQRRLERDNAHVQLCFVKPDAFGDARFVVEPGLAQLMIWPFEPSSDHITRRGVLIPTKMHDQLVVPFDYEPTPQSHYTIEWFSYETTGMYLDHLFALFSSPSNGDDDEQLPPA